MTGPMMWTDGNALADPLHDVFRPDVTAAMAGCSNCGWTGPMAGVRVFDHALAWWPAVPPAIRSSCGWCTAPVVPGWTCVACPICNFPS
jgi:hypothetical protein